MKSVEGKFKTFSQTGIWGLGSGGRQPYPTYVRTYCKVPDAFRKPHPEEFTTPPTTSSEPGVAGDLLGSQEQPWLGLGSQEQPWPENFWGLKSHRGRIVNGVSAAAAASVRRARCGFSEEGGPQEADDSQESGSKLAAFESSQKNSPNRITTWRSSDFCNIQSNQALGALFRENSSPKLE